MGGHLQLQVVPVRQVILRVLLEGVWVYGAQQVQGVLELESGRYPKTREKKVSALQLRPEPLPEEVLPVFQ